VNGVQPEHEIPRYRFTTVQQLRAVIDNRQPAVFEGALDGWPALTQWAPERLKTNYGNIEISHGRTRMRFGDFIDAMEAGESFYFGNIDASQTIPGLRHDIAFPKCYWRKEASLINYWFARAGALTRLHFDHSHNLFAQVRGQKRFTLFSPAKSQLLKPSAATWYSTKSACDYWDGGPELVTPVPPDYQFVVGPGEMLFLPYRWWHRVESLTPSVSVNMFWLTPLLLLKVLPRLVSDFMRREVFGQSTAVSNVKPR
jgi:hypothetical protein